MRKLTICISENKDADQLCGNRKADQCLCLRYTNSKIPLLSKSKISSFYQSPVLVQLGLCRTCSETTLLVFPRGGSYIQVNLIITLSLGSIETDRVISELCYNEVIYYRHIAKKINLGAMTWPCYIENCIIMRRVIMRLKCKCMAKI